MADLYALLRSAYEGRSLAVRELARKTASIVQEHTRAGVIHETINVYEITPETLQKIARSSQSPAVKVFNLLKSIEHKVMSDAFAAPYLFSIGERAEAIAEAFKQHQISTQEALKRLEELIREVNAAEHEQAERGISGVPFAIFWVLKQEYVPISVAEKAAAEMTQALSEYPYWRTSDKQARQIRRKLYQLLADRTTKTVTTQLVDKIMSVIQRHR